MKKLDPWLLGPYLKFHDSDKLNVYRENSFML